MRPLTDTFRDPWLAPRLGASAKKTWVAFRGLFLAWAVHAVFGYAAHMIAGVSPLEIWQRYRLFPGQPQVSGLPEMAWWFGLVAGGLLVMVAAAGVAKITYRELKGDDFYGASDAWRFAIEHGRSTIGTPIVMALVFVVCVIAVAVAGWVGRIPWVGPLLLGILALPVLLVGLFAAFMLTGLLVSFLYAPAVIGTTGEDALEGGVQCMGLLWYQPWQTAASTFVATAAALLGTFIYILLSLAGLVVTANVLEAAMGDAFGSFVTGALAYVPSWLPTPGEVIAWLLPHGAAGLMPVLGPAQPPPLGIGALGSLLGGLALLCLLGSVAAYAVASVVAGHTAAYVGLRRRKDGEDLLSWPDEVDELEEQLAAASETAEETSG